MSRLKKGVIQKQTKPGLSVRRFITTGKCESRKQSGWSGSEADL